MSEVNQGIINQGQTVVKMVAPLPPITVSEYRYYFSSIKNVSMHRTDGRRLLFTHGIYKTNMKYDIEYIEREIADGHPNVRRATEDEIQTYKMITDPTETIKEQLLSDPVVRAELEAQIREEMLSGQNSGTLISGTQVQDLKERIRSGSATITLDAGTSNPAPLGGIVGTDKLAAAGDSNSAAVSK